VDHERGCGEQRSRLSPIALIGRSVVATPVGLRFLTSFVRTSIARTNRHHHGPIGSRRNYEAEDSRISPPAFSHRRHWAACNGLACFWYTGQQPAPGSEEVSRSQANGDVRVTNGNEPWKGRCDKVAFRRSPAVEVSDEHGRRFGCDRPPYSIDATDRRSIAKRTAGDSRAAGPCAKDAAIGSGY